jgi:hypothetical protein
VVVLSDVRGPAGGLGVRRGGGRQIAVELVQVRRCTATVRSVRH